MRDRSSSQASTGFLGVALLLLGPAVLWAQPGAIPIDQLTPAQFESLPDAQPIAGPRVATTLGELRSREAARREAHAAGAVAGEARMRAELARWEQVRLARVAEQARQQDAMVMEMMAFAAGLAADNPEMVRRARERGRSRREAAALRGQALEASSTSELRRIEKKLQRLERRGG